MTKTALIIGCGDDTGAAIARAFAKDGLHVCLSRRPRHSDKLDALAKSIRKTGGEATPCPVDARDEEAIIELFNHVETNIGPLEVVVFNIGANVRFSITETTSRVYRKVWEMAGFAGFLTGREAVLAQHIQHRLRALICGHIACAHDVEEAVLCLRRGAPERCIEVDRALLGQRCANFLG